MKSKINDDFLDAYRNLPKEVRQQARRAYTLWQANHYHSSLHFKRVDASEPIYSVRIGIGWRVLGYLDNDTMVWFWIGSHADYDKLLA